ncbi:MAG: hypothetical protein ABI697_10035, partial [Devosia sp.]
MRRTKVALIVDLIWVAAIVVAVAGFWLGGLSLVSVGFALFLMAAAFSGSLAVAERVERHFQQKLAELGRAVGIAARDLVNGISIEAIIANLAGRLERASQFKTAFMSLAHLAMVSSAEGEILGATRGLVEAAPDALEGRSAATVLGEGYASGGLPDDALVTLGHRRFAAHQHDAGAGRTLMEFVPAGAYIPDDELDAFATALAGGHTGFRFDHRSLDAFPALAALTEGL